MRISLLVTFFLFGLIACKKNESGPTFPPYRLDEVLVAIEHKVLIEPTVSVSCGACPLAHYQINVLEDSLNDVIHMSHYLFGPLYHPYTKHLMDRISKTVYTPLAHVNRRQEDGSVVYYPVTMMKGITGLERSEGSNIGIQMESVSVGEGFLVTANLWTEQLDLMEELRLTIVLVEKEVTGQGSGYDQRNYGDEDPSHPYYQRGDWIEGFVHTNVIRDVITDFDGAVVDLSTGSTTFTATVESAGLLSEPKNYRLIAFVSRDDEKVMPILNAAVCDMGQ